MILKHGAILRFALKSTTYIELQRAQCGTDTELPVIKCYGSHTSLQARFTQPQTGGLLNKTTALGFNLRDYTVYLDPQTGGTGGQFDHVGKFSMYPLLGRRIKFNDCAFLVWLDFENKPHAIKKTGIFLFWLDFENNPMDRIIKRYF